MDRNQLLTLVVGSLALQACGARLPCGASPGFILTGNDVEPVLSCDGAGAIAMEAARRVASRFEVLSVTSQPNLILVRRKPPPLGVAAVEPRGEMVLTTPQRNVRWRMNGSQLGSSLTAISSYSLSPDGRLLAAGSLSGRDGRFLGLFVLDVQERRWRPIRALPDGLYADMVAGWIDERQVIFDDGRSIIVRSLPQGRERVVTPGRVISVSPNRKLVAATVGASVRILSVEGFQERCPGLVPRQALPQAVWSPDSRYVWVSSDNRATALMPNLAKLIDVEACRVAGTRLVAAGSGVSRWNWVNMETVSALSEIGQ